MRRPNYIKLCEKTKDTFSKAQGMADKLAAIAEEYIDFEDFGLTCTIDNDCSLCFFFEQDIPVIVSVFTFFQRLEENNYISFTWEEIKSMNEA